jgi:hypothetical protein
VVSEYAFLFMVVAFLGVGAQKRCNESVTKRVTMSNSVKPRSDESDKRGLEQTRLMHSWYGLEEESFSESWKSKSRCDSARDFISGS